MNPNYNKAFFIHGKMFQFNSHVRICIFVYQGTYVILGICSSVYFA